MSIGAELFERVSTKSVNAQYGPHSAANSNGEFVVAWTDTWSPTDTDIRAQRYNSVGVKLGPEIIVAFSTAREHDASVAIDNAGQFVVTYTQDSGSDTNVLAQRFDANGNILGAPVQVGVSVWKEQDASVAMDGQGGFAVSFTQVNGNTGDTDVWLKRYDAGGNLLQVLGVSTLSVAEGHSSIAMAPDGRFAVAWQQNYNGPDDDIWVRGYSASGVLASTYAVAFSSAHDITPSIAMDDAGNAVVAWSSDFDIKARRIFAAPTAFGWMGPVISITSNGPVPSDLLPSVALNKQGGTFVVTYSSTDSNTGSVAEVSAFDQVTTYHIGGEDNPVVSMDGFGDYLVTYVTTIGNSGDPNFDMDIHARVGYLPF
jgi:hypothetical protein